MFKLPGLRNPSLMCLGIDLVMEVRVLTRIYPLTLSVSCSVCSLFCLFCSV